MNLIQISVILLVFNYQLESIDAGSDGTVQENAGQKKLNEKFFAKLFEMRRRETRKILEIIMHENYYEQQFKMLEAAMEKILQILDETKIVQQTSQYNPLTDPFPVTEKRLVDAIVVNLENTCLFGEIILHIPDLTYRVLDKLEKTRAKTNRTLGYRELIDWCLKNSKLFYNRIVDKKSQELLFLLDQELHPERRIADYINPYRQKESAAMNASKSKTKQRKKLKRGPQLAGRDEL